MTRKVRRVATFSTQQLWEACQINGVTVLALTFADYLDPIQADRRQPTTRVQDFIDDMQRVTGLPVCYVGTGPHSVIDRESEIGLLAA